MLHQTDARSESTGRLGRANACMIYWKVAPAPPGINHALWVEDLDFNPDGHTRYVGCPALPCSGDHKALLHGGELFEYLSRKSRHFAR